jgi:uncharacterized phage protein (TIGR01671 family)
MRPIKFRGKAISNGKWVYGFPFIRDKNIIFILDDSWSKQTLRGEEWIFSITRIKPETLGQFTGLHDKNKKEIYEGDVLTDFEEKDFICIIKWEDNRGHWACYDYKNRYIGFAFEYIANGLEVIGNIYENPELLRKE